MSKNSDWPDTIRSESDEKSPRSSIAVPHRSSFHVKSFTCETCRRSFKNKYALYKHKKNPCTSKGNGTQSDFLRLLSIKPTLNKATLKERFVLQRARDPHGQPTTSELRRPVSRLLPAPPALPFYSSETDTCSSQDSDARLRPVERASETDTCSSQETDVKLKSSLRPVEFIDVTKVNSTNLNTNEPDQDPLAPILGLDDEVPDEVDPGTFAGGIFGVGASSTTAPVVSDINPIVPQAENASVLAKTHFDYFMLSEAKEKVNKPHFSSNLSLTENSKEVLGDLKDIQSNDNFRTEPPVPTISAVPTIVAIPSSDDYSLSTLFPVKKITLKREIPSSNQNQFTNQSINQSIGNPNHASIIKNKTPITLLPQSAIQPSIAPDDRDYKITDPETIYKPSLNIKPKDTKLQSSSKLLHTLLARDKFVSHPNKHKHISKTADTSTLLRNLLKQDDIVTTIHCSNISKNKNKRSNPSKVKVNIKLDEKETISKQLLASSINFTQRSNSKKIVLSKKLRLNLDSISRKISDQKDTCKVNQKKETKDVPVGVNIVNDTRDIIKRYKNSKTVDLSNDSDEITNDSENTVLDKCNSKEVCSNSSNDKNSSILKRKSNKDMDMKGKKRRLGSLENTVNYDKAGAQCRRSRNSMLTELEGMNEPDKVNQIVEKIMEPRCLNPFSIHNHKACEDYFKSKNHNLNGARVRRFQNVPEKNIFESRNRSVDSRDSSVCRDSFASDTEPTSGTSDDEFSVSESRSYSLRNKIPDSEARGRSRLRRRRSKPGLYRDKSGSSYDSENSSKDGCVSIKSSSVSRRDCSQSESVSSRNSSIARLNSGGSVKVRNELKTKLIGSKDKSKGENPPKKGKPTRSAVRSESICSRDSSRASSIRSRSKSPAESNSRIHLAIDRQKRTNKILNVLKNFKEIKRSKNINYRYSDFKDIYGVKECSVVLEKIDISKINPCQTKVISQNEVESEKSECCSNEILSDRKKTTQINKDNSTSLNKEKKKMSDEAKLLSLKLFREINASLNKMESDRMSYRIDLQQTEQGKINSEMMPQNTITMSDVEKVDSKQSNNEVLNQTKLKRRQSKVKFSKSQVKCKNKTKFNKNSENLNITQTKEMVECQINKSNDDQQAQTISEEAKLVSLKMFEELKMITNLGDKCLNSKSCLPGNSKHRKSCEIGHKCKNSDPLFANKTECGKNSTSSAINNSILFKTKSISDDTALDDLISVELNPDNKSQTNNTSGSHGTNDDIVNINSTPGKSTKRSKRRKENNNKYFLFRRKIRKKKKFNPLVDSARGLTDNEVRRLEADCRRRKAVVVLKRLPNFDFSDMFCDIFNDFNDSDNINKFRFDKVRTDATLSLDKGMNLNSLFVIRQNKGKYKVTRNKDLMEILQETLQMPRMSQNSTLLYHELIKIIKEKMIEMNIKWINNRMDQGVYAKTECNDKKEQITDNHKGANLDIVDVRGHSACNHEESTQAEDKSYRIDIKSSHEYKKTCNLKTIACNSDLLCLSDSSFVTSSDLGLRSDESGINPEENLEVKSCDKEENFYKENDVFDKRKVADKSVRGDKDGNSVLDGRKNIDARSVTTENVSNCSNCKSNNMNGDSENLDDKMDQPGMKSFRIDVECSAPDSNLGKVDTKSSTITSLDTLNATTSNTDVIVKCDQVLKTGCANKVLRANSSENKENKSNNVDESHVEEDNSITVGISFDGIKDNSTNLGDKFDNLGDKYFNFRDKVGSDKDTSANIDDNLKDKSANKKDNTDNINDKSANAEGEASNLLDQSVTLMHKVDNTVKKSVHVEDISDNVEHISNVENVCNNVTDKSGNVEAKSKNVEGDEHSYQDNLVDSHNKYFCTFCDYVTMVEPHLFKHICLHFINLKCPFCDNTCSSGSCLRNHMESCHSELLKPCKLSDQTKSKSLGSQHIGRISCDRSVSRYNDCKSPDLFKLDETTNVLKSNNIVSKDLQKKTKLSYNINQSISNDRKFKCKICPYSTKHIGNLNRHLKVSHQSTNYTCHYCRWGTKNLGSIYAHISFHHKNEYCYEKSRLKTSSGGKNRGIAKLRKNNISLSDLNFKNIESIESTIQEKSTADETNDTNSELVDSHEKNFESVESNYKNSELVESREKIFESVESNDKNSELVESREKMFESVESKDKNSELVKSHEKNFESVESKDKNSELVESHEKNFESVESKVKNSELVESHEKNFESVESNNKNSELVESHEKNFESVESKDKNSELVDSREKNFKSVESKDKNSELVDSREKNFKSVELNDENSKLVDLNDKNPELVDPNIQNPELMHSKENPAVISPSSAEDGRNSGSIQTSEELCELTHSNIIHSEVVKPIEKNIVESSGKSYGVIEPIHRISNLMGTTDTKSEFAEKSNNYKLAIPNDKTLKLGVSDDNNLELIRSNKQNSDSIETDANFELVKKTNKNSEFVVTNNENSKSVESKENNLDLLELNEENSKLIKIINKNSEVGEKRYNNSEYENSSVDSNVKKMFTSEIHLSSINKTSFIDQSKTLSTQDDRTGAINCHNQDFDKDAAESFTPVIYDNALSENVTDYSTASESFCLLATNDTENPFLANIKAKPLTPIHYDNVSIDENIGSDYHIPKTNEKSTLISQGKSISAIERSKTFSPLDITQQFSSLQPRSSAFRNTAIGANKPFLPCESTDSFVEMNVLSTVSNRNKPDVPANLANIHDSFSDQSLVDRSKDLFLAVNDSLSPMRQDPVSDVTMPFYSSNSTHHLSNAPSPYTTDPNMLPSVNFNAPFDNSNIPFPLDQNKPNFFSKNTPPYSANLQNPSPMNFSAPLKSNVQFSPNSPCLGQENNMYSSNSSPFLSNVPYLSSNNSFSSNPKPYSTHNDSSVSKDSQYTSMDCTPYRAQDRPFLTNRLIPENYQTAFETNYRNPSPMCNVTANYPGVTPSMGPLDPQVSLSSNVSPYRYPTNATLNQNYTNL